MQPVAETFDALVESELSIWGALLRAASEAAVAGLQEGGGRSWERIHPPEPHPLAAAFLEYLVEPETAVRVAFVDDTCNPVAQMGDPAVLAAFSRSQLEAIQWDTLEEDIARCADYDIVPDLDALLALLRDAAVSAATR